MNSFEHFKRFVDWEYWELVFDMVDFTDSYQHFWSHPIMQNEASIRAMGKLGFTVDTMQYLFHVFMVWKYGRNRQRFHSIEEETAKKWMRTDPAFAHAGDILGIRERGRFVELPPCMHINGVMVAGRYPVRGMYVSIHETPDREVDMRLLVVACKEAYPIPDGAVWDEPYFWCRFRFKKDAKAIWPQVLHQAKEYPRQPEYRENLGAANVDYYVPAARLAIHHLLNH